MASPTLWRAQCYTQIHTYGQADRHIHTHTQTQTHIHAHIQPASQPASQTDTHTHMHTRANTHKQGASLPPARYAHSAVSFGWCEHTQTLSVGGGNNPGSVRQRGRRSCPLAMNTHKQGASLPPARYAHSAVSFRGFLYVFGG